MREEIDINATPEEVFRHVDDIKNTGWHMTKTSMPLMGSKLHLEVLSKNYIGLGATYRWHGQVMGFQLDFSEVVTEWIPNEKRVWKTIGEPRILIMNGYEMSYLITPHQSKTRLVFEIRYGLPRPLFWRMIGLLLSGWYSRWCLRKMCRDATSALERKLGT